MTLPRREFITLLGGATVSWPIAVRAEQPGMPVVGFLSSRTADDSAQLVASFLQGLKQTGYIVGQNVAIEYRWSQGQYDRMPEMAADLVRSRVDVILAASDSAALAAKSATTTIPIVFTSGNDPVRLGLVASLNRPSGNLTGVNNLNFALMGKRVQLLRELAPSVTAVTALINPTSPSAETVTRDLQSAARDFDFELRILQVRDDTQIDAALSTIAQPGALIVGADGFYMTRSEKLGGLTARYRLPATPSPSDVLIGMIAKRFRDQRISFTHRVILRRRCISAHGRR